MNMSAQQIGKVVSQYNEELLYPKTGTATSSPRKRMISPQNKVFATLWSMKKEAYADSTIN